MNTLKTIGKYSAMGMIFLNVLANDALARTLKEKPVLEQNELQDNVDKKIEDYYKKLIAVPNHEYMDLFKKLRKEKKEGELRDGVYKDCLEIMVDGDFPIGGGAIDVLIVVFGGGKIEKGIQDKLLQRIAQSKSNIFFVGQLQKYIQVSIRELESEISLAKSQARLGESQARLDKITKENEQLDEIISSLKKFNELFQKNRQK